MNNKIFFIQLNELNFDLVDRYVTTSKNKFPNLNYIRNFYKNFITYGEKDYKNLEPWIQWTSVQLGKNYEEHKIFRLGDIVKHSKYKQIFELIENKGFKVGAISPMNADNRLKDPAYFIPDPWTDTKSDCSNFSKKVSLMLKQSVNDNSSKKVTLSSIFIILEIFFRTFNFKRSVYLIKLVLSSIIKPWKKSLILDYIIHLIHMYYFNKKSPAFSSVFFNAGAHIQHHYYLNSRYVENLPKNPDWYIANKFDPIEDMLEVYEQIIKDYVELSKKNDLIIATGLRQIPCDKVKFYYRLKNHASFLKKIGVKFSKVLPRMTRDFEVIFENDQHLTKAKNILGNLKLKKNGSKIFNEIEERKKSLFITLTYPYELKMNDIVINNNFEINFFNEVVFVAIKNGIHDSKGYVFCSTDSKFEIPKEPVHVSKLFDIIYNIY